MRWLRRLLPWLFCLLLALPVQAIDITLSWDASPSPTVTGYKVYHGTTPLPPFGDLPPIDVGNVLTYTVTGLSENRPNFFALTAYDAAGNESTYSNIVSKPGKIQNLRRPAR